MNNEERILSILETMQGDISGLKADVSDLRSRVTAIELTQENKVMKYLHTLAEGHEAIMRKLVPETRVEAVEDDVAVLKTVTKEHSSDIAELKQAK